MAAAALRSSRKGDSGSHVAASGTRAADAAPGSLYREPLRETWALVQALAYGSPFGVIGLDASGRVSLWNPAAERLFGWSEAEVLGLRAPRSLKPVLRASRPGREFWVRSKDGERVEVGLWSSRVRSPLGADLGLIARFADLSQRRRLERDVVEIGDAERRRIGHDLHDGLGQLLTGVAFGLKALKGKSRGAGGRRAAFLLRHVQSAIRMTRELARQLDPAPDSDGVRLSLETLARDLSRLFAVRCDFSAQGSAPPGRETALHLYRIAQEAAHNAVKHGRATRVAIRLRGGPASWSLSVRDNGLGVRGGSGPDGNGGLGGRIMRYRARQCGGQLRVRSLARGTEVRCRIPRTRLRRPSPR